MALIFQWIEGMADAGANQYTFHIEATEDPMQCIRKIREVGMKVFFTTPGEYSASFTCIVSVTIFVSDIFDLLDVFV